MFAYVVAALISPPQQPRADAPTSPPAFPSAYAPFVRILSPRELASLREGAFRFCRVAGRSATFEMCMTFQDAAIVDVDNWYRELRRPHADLAYLRSAFESCHEVYRENDSADVRVLENCLGEVYWVTAQGDREALRRGEDPDTWLDIAADPD